MQTLRVAVKFSGARCPVKAVGARRPLAAPRAAAPEKPVDPHTLLNVDVSPMTSDPGDLGRVAEGVLDAYERLDQIKAPAPRRGRPPAAVHASHGDPRHMLNVDEDPLGTDPGDLGRVAPGVLEKFEHLDKIK